MQGLSPDEFCIIFQQLETPRDLVRCSAVSKAWAAGVHQIRPMTLRLHCFNSSVTLSEAPSETSWLQTWDTQGRLQQVTDLTVEETVPSVHYHKILCFSQNVPMCAGLWSLRRCCLAGPFCIHSAVELLPATLQSLSLRPILVTKGLCLSAFEMFTFLESLTTAYGDRPSDFTDDELCADEKFILDKCFMPKLHTLDCGVPQTDNRVGLDCSPDSDMRVRECLPNLNNLLVGMPVGLIEDDDQRAIAFAGDVASWPGLHRLQMELPYLLYRVDPSAGLKMVLHDNPELVIVAKPYMERKKVAGRIVWPHITLPFFPLVNFHTIFCINELVKELIRDGISFEVQHC